MERLSDLRDVVLAQYASGSTIEQCARNNHIGEARVSAWIHAAGIARSRGARPKSAADELKREFALADLAQSNDTLSTVARRHGIPRATLDTWADAERDIEYKGEWIRVGAILRGSARDVA